MSVGNLPVRVLREQVLHYFENQHPEFRDELEAEIKFNKLSPAIIYDDSKLRIRDLAEIDSDRRITISEPFLGFLWTFSHLSVCFYFEQNKPIDTIEEGSILDRAIKSFQYGLSLFRRWSEWDVSLPNPEFPNAFDDYLERANGVFITAACWVLGHEYAHHSLGHDLLMAPDDKKQAQQEEKAADKYAAETILSGVEVPGSAKDHTVRVGIMIGLCSILFSPAGWDGGQDHPAPEERISELVDHLTAGDPEDECWAWLGSSVVAWSIVNGKGDELTVSEGTKKEKAIELIKIAQQT